MLLPKLSTMSPSDGRVVIHKESGRTKCIRYSLAQVMGDNTGLLIEEQFLHRRERSVGWCMSLDSQP